MDVTSVPTLRLMRDRDHGGWVGRPGSIVVRLLLKKCSMPGGLEVKSPQLVNLQVGLELQSVTDDMIDEPLTEEVLLWPACGPLPDYRHSTRLGGTDRPMETPSLEVDPCAMVVTSCLLLAPAVLAPRCSGL